MTPQIKYGKNKESEFWRLISQDEIMIISIILMVRRGGKNFPSFNFGILRLFMGLFVANVFDGFIWFDEFLE